MLSTGNNSQRKPKALMGSNFLVPASVSSKRFYRPSLQTMTGRRLCAPTRWSTLTSSLNLRGPALVQPPPTRRLPRVHTPPSQKPARDHILLEDSTCPFEFKFANGDVINVRQQKDVLQYFLIARRTKTRCCGTSTILCAVTPVESSPLGHSIRNRVLYLVAVPCCPLRFHSFR